jgi:hypothetical protein
MDSYRAALFKKPTPVKPYNKMNLNEITSFSEFLGLYCYFEGPALLWKFKESEKHRIPKKYRHQAMTSEQVYLFWKFVYTLKT